MVLVAKRPRQKSTPCHVGSFWQGLANQCKAKTNFHLSWKGFCLLKVLNMAKSLPRKVKVGFSFALGSQPLQIFEEIKKSLLLDKAADVFHYPHFHLIFQHKLVNLMVWLNLGSDSIVPVPGGGS